jgi:hypothetical protein
MLQQQQQHHHHNLQHHSSFPSPITPTYDKKVFSSPSSTSSGSCRYDLPTNNSSSNNNTTSLALEVSSTGSSLYASPTSTPSSTTSSSNQKSSSAASSSYGQYHFGDVYGSSGNFLSNSYASAAALGSSCSALPSPTIYPPTPPPSSTPWLHQAWFGSMENAGYMKTPKNNPFEN